MQSFVGRLTDCKKTKEVGQMYNKERELLSK